MDKDDAIDNLVECLDLDAIAAWSDILGVEFELPPLDDMYPDWEDELRVKVGEAMAKIGDT